MVGDPLRQRVLLEQRPWGGSFEPQQGGQVVGEEEVREGWICKVLQVSGRTCNKSSNEREVTAGLRAKGPNPAGLSNGLSLVVLTTEWGGSWSREPVGDNSRNPGES